MNQLNVGSTDDSLPTEAESQNPILKPLEQRKAEKFRDLIKPKDEEEEKKTAKPKGKTTPEKKEQASFSPVTTGSIFDLSRQTGTLPQKPTTLEAPIARDLSQVGEEDETGALNTSFGSSWIEEPKKTEVDFSIEARHDLAYTNPLRPITAVPVVEGESAPTTKPMSSEEIYRLVEKLVAKIETLEKTGETQTTISLKGDLLKGATLTVTSFDSARKEFNLMFQNLSPQAKAMLDLEANQTQLMRALESRGYTVHIIVTTTQLETRVIPGESSQEGRESKEKQSGQGQGQNQDTNDNR